MLKIILPSDLSEIADNALRYALHFFASCKAQLSVIHINEKEKSQGNFTNNPSDFNNDYRVYQQKWANSSVKINFVFGTGEPEEEIENYLSQQHYNLMLIGTKGKSGITDLLFGSVSQKIIKQTSLPVLAIPEKAVFEQIEHIAFATDLIEMQGKALAQLDDFAKLFDANFHFVHIIQEETRSFKDKKNNFKLSVDEILGEDQFDIISIKNEDIINGLNSYTQQNNVDIIVLLHHQKSNLNKLFTISYTEKLSKHSKIPVLIFKE